MSTPKTFLVLDDDDDSRFLSAHALHKVFADARIIECSSIAEALKRAGSTQIDAIITDHHLGDGRGADFVRQLRSLCHECPVVMVTASSDPAVHRRAYEGGAARVFFGDDLDVAGYLREVFAAPVPPS